MTILIFENQDVYRDIERLGPWTRAWPRAYGAEVSVLGPARTTREGV